MANILSRADWDVRRTILSCASHDYTGIKFAIAIQADGVQHEFEEHAPDAVKQFEKEHGQKIDDYIREPLGKISDLLKEHCVFRLSETPPDKKELDAKTKIFKNELKKHKAEVQRRGKIFLRFMKKHKGESSHADEYVRIIEENLARDREFPVQCFTEMKPVLKKVNMDEMLKYYVAESTHIDRQGRPVKVSYRRRKSVGNVVIDPNLVIDRGLGNLISDAIVHGNRKTPVEVELNRRNGTLLIHVTNKGPKLSPDALATIGRKRWTQHPEDPKRGHGKWSAGMACRLHGGDLEVTNHKRGGKHFGPRLTLAIPIRRR